MQREGSTALCQCGCGQPAPIAKMTRRRLGHVKGQPLRFINGHNARVRVVTDETRAKVSAAKRGDRNPMKRPEVAAKVARALTGKKKPPDVRAKHRGPRPDLQGPNHWNWKGDEITYHTAHDRLRQTRPYTGVCERCDAKCAKGKTHFAYLGPSGGYSLNPDDYEELCITCHRRFDAIKRP